MVFDNAQVFTPLQVTFRGTHWITIWTLLQKEEDIPQVKWGCGVLETIMMEIFSNNG
jgi:hypothetical protein